MISDLCWNIFALWGLNQVILLLLRRLVSLVWLLIDFWYVNWWLYKKLRIWTLFTQWSGPRSARWVWSLGKHTDEVYFYWNLVQFHKKFDQWIFDFFIASGDFQAWMMENKILNSRTKHTSKMLIFNFMMPRKSKVSNTIISNGDIHI